MWHEEQLFIGGELCDARNGSTFENINPATEEILGVSADAGEEDFDFGNFGAYIFGCRLCQ